jgi:Phosphoenolpyruvate-protein kinase (PTS system EI component in bacteria)
MATELRGIGIGREAAVGEVYRWQRAEGVTEHRKASGSAGEEKDSLTTALAEGVTEVRAQAGQSDADTAAILEALVMIFEDDELVSMASPHFGRGLGCGHGAVSRTRRPFRDDGRRRRFQSRV